MPKLNRAVKKSYIIVEDSGMARHPTVQSAIAIAATEHEKNRSRKFLVCEVRASIDSTHDTVVTTHY